MRHREPKASRGTAAKETRIRGGRGAPPPLFETCLLEGELYIHMYAHRRGKAKEQDEDEGRKKRVAMTRDDGERKRNDGEGEARVAR